MKGKSVGLYIPNDIDEKVSEWINNQKEKKSLSSAIIDLISKEVSNDNNSLKACLQNLHHEISELKVIVKEFKEIK